MKIYIVDNGGQWTHREFRVVRDLGYEAKIIPNTTPVSEIDADALILSGGAPRISFEAPKLGNCIDYLEKFSGPILGICVGHQLMAIFHGGKAGPAKIPEYGLAKIKILERDDLFRGIEKEEFLVWESHNDEVKKAPGFKILASSENCKIQAMKHEKKKHYGLQFHPEVNNTEYGEKIIENFIKTI
ncbi:MAG: GMP synthase subunit A [Candidatus Altiarchaeota archaeon]